MLDRKFIRLMRLYSNYYSLLIGISARIYSFEDRRVKSNKWLSAYAFFANFVVIAGVPFVMHAGYLHLSKTDSRNRLTAATDIVNMCLHFSAIMFTIAIRWLRDKRFYGIALQYFALDEHYFNQLTRYPTIQRHVDYIFCFKFALTTLQCAAVYIESFLSLHGAQLTIEFLLVTVYKAVLQSILLGVMVHYFLALLHIYHRYTLINEELSKLHASLLQLLTDSKYILGASSFTLQQLCRVAAADLKQMCQVHYALTQLLNHLNDSLKFQTMTVLLVCLIRNITFGYYAVLMLNGTSGFPTSFSGITIGALTIVVIFSDLYLLYHICEGTTCEYRRTGEILKMFRDFPRLEKAFETQLEIFCLQLMRHKLNINMAGMFNLNRETSLAMLSFTLRHTLILVQSDYENRFLKPRRS